MATTTPIRSGYDTWVTSADPTSKHPRNNRLRVQSTSAYSYLYFPLGPELRGNTILSAILYLYGRGTGWGTPTVTVQAITQSWDAATLTWNNKPTVGSTSATRTQTNPADLTEWAIDVSALVQEFASGSRWRGVRISISDTTERRFNSLNADSHKPRLEVRWTEAPAAPVDLSPSGGRAVGSSRPVLTWSNENNPDRNTLTAFEVQIDPAANGTTPAFSYMKDPADTASLDLSQTAYAGLAAGATTQWRVRSRNDSNLWSLWSDWASFSRADKGTVAITTPGATVAEFTPPVAWSTSFTQKAWQLLVTDPSDPSIVLHDTGRKSGTTQDYTIPAKDPATDQRILRDTRDYRLVVRAWDDVDREGTPGDPRFASAVVVFHYADDPTPNQVTNLAVSQVVDTPYVDLTWRRATTPDAWMVVINGRVVDDGIAGADLLVSGDFYKYRYKDARPGLALNYQVKPTVNGLTAGSPVVTETTAPTGLWVMGPDDIDVPIGVYDDFGSFSMPDNATTIELPQGIHPVRITQGVNGLRGDIRGVLWETVGRSADSWADRLLTIKKRLEPVTLYFGDMVIRAVIFDVLVEPSGDGGRTRPVSFSFFETGTPEWMD